MKDLPEAQRAKFVKELESTTSSVLYMLKFSQEEGQKRTKNLRLLRGCTVISIKEKSATLDKVTLNVLLDGAQYKMDMMKLAVEDSMFVEESYASGQAVVRMPA